MKRIKFFMAMLLMASMLVACDKEKDIEQPDTTGTHVDDPQEEDHNILYGRAFQLKEDFYISGYHIEDTITLTFLTDSTGERLVISYFEGEREEDIQQFFSYTFDEESNEGAMQHSDWGTQPVSFTYLPEENAINVNGMVHTEVFLNQ